MQKIIKEGNIDKLPQLTCTTCECVWATNDWVHLVDEGGVNVVKSFCPFCGSFEKAPFNKS